MTNLTEQPETVEVVTQADRPLAEHRCWWATGLKLSHRHWFQDNALMPTCERCGTLIDREHKEVGPVSWEPEKRREIVTLQDRYAISTAAMTALGEWLAWPDAGRDGPREVTVQQTLSFLQGLPNKLGYGHSLALADEAASQPREGVRLRMFLEILAASGGVADATEYPWNWINAFCEEHEGRDPDTFNRASNAGYTTVSHDSDTDTGVVRLTGAGRAYLDTAPTDQAQGGEVEREVAIKAALCLSGFAGEGLCVEGFDDPADVYLDITKALGMPEADDDDLRVALAQNGDPS